jgi:hypothetical protein
VNLLNGSGGSVEGFASVAFPIVRRVFAGLIANDLVSVQPMSLPSGLIFFLDFTFSDDVAGQDPRLGQASTDSIYGQGRIGSGIIDGVILNSAEMDKQPYGFSSAYSSPTGSIAGSALAVSAVTDDLNGNGLDDNPAGDATVGDLIAADAGIGSMINWDADLMSEHSGSFLKITSVDFSSITDFNTDHLSQIILPFSGATDGAVGTQVRRLTREDPNNPGSYLFFYVKSDAWATPAEQDHDAGSYEIRDVLDSGNLGVVHGANTLYTLEENANIPEIDIKVDSTAITATTKKLKAKWTPELGQDLNAYHNLDAEVELTSILSEQIALEIDREILADLVNGATAGTYYWSRSPRIIR